MRYTKLVSLLLAAGMLASCGSTDTVLSALDSGTDDSTAVTTVTTAATSVTTTKKTLATRKPIDDSEVEKEESPYYDIKPILNAYRDGTRNELTYEQKEVLDSAKHFLEDYLTDDMTQYQKELTIHDKIAELVDYDAAELDALDADEYQHDPDSETPYGALVNNKAICTGYALTFNLLAEMAGIKCVTVVGTNKEGEEHLWNKVKLDDGKWYGVDMTWDDMHSDTGDLYLKHRFFNGTDDFFAEHDHVWDDKDYSDAIGTQYSYMNMEAVYIADLEQLEELVQSNAAKGIGEAVFIPDSEVLELWYGNFEASDKFTEIRRLLYRNGYTFYQECTCDTDNGTAIMICFKTFEEGDPTYEEDSSSETDSESSSENADKDSQSSSENESSSSQAQTDNGGETADQTGDTDHTTEGT
ncbi:MAG: hypothetical protein IKN17_00570 [Ruminococcus sp.]|nr:hypothetical protein [Ruminococcus sp.]